MGLLVRELRTEDVPKLYRMYRSLSEETKRLFHHPLFLGLSCVWRVLAQVALVLSTIGPLRGVLLRTFPLPVFISVVALSERGEVVGFAFLKMRGYLPRRRPSAELGVVVSDPFQGRGLGSRLVEVVLRLARERGVGEVLLSVLPDNVRAIRLYRKFGFEFVGETTDYWRGRRLRAKVMRLRLGKATGH